ncbi:DUF3944 domain-containing protein [Moraxella osloensis]|jgi:uncharacterized protein YaaW (UPF0174 family)|nr:DUF3944 domain-containing protein [Moraxella osloensis]QRO14239.1 DUF3944 domain-containing protein [Moraxella osloensis]
MSKASKYRDDPDLTFLQFLDWDDLQILAYALIKDSEGTEQWTGGLAKTLTSEIARYTKAELPKHIWQSVAAELQLFGGDTVVNTFRGKGVPYNEIVRDVGKRVGADFSNTATTIEIEDKVLRTLFNKVTTLNDLDLINKTLKEKGYLGFSSLLESPFSTIKQGLGFGTGGATAGIAALNVAKNFLKANPFTTLVTAPLTVKDISAPAYRVTIPSVCLVAMLRTKYLTDAEKFNEF